MSVKPAVLRRLMREISDLKSSPPEGIRIITNEDNLCDVTGIIQGPEGTPYAGGYFRIKFHFTEEFPAAPPKCRMLTKIFHPNVSTAGEICVNTLKKDWQSSYGIAHILVVVKCLLIHPNPESALDEEAGKLLLEDYNRFAEHAQMITSVHATPRTTPPEFASTSGASASSAYTKHTSPTPSQSSSTPSVVYPSTSPPSTHKSVGDAENANLPIVIPLSGKPASSDKISTSLFGDKTTDKDRHPSPSPLSTADGNVASAAISTATVPAASIPAKAIKRTAGGAAGTDKRKKALKRL